MPLPPPHEKKRMKRGRRRSSARSRSRSRSSSPSSRAFHFRPRHDGSRGLERLPPELFERVLTYLPSPGREPRTLHNASHAMRDRVVDALGSAPPLMREHVGTHGERVQRFYRHGRLRLPERIVFTFGRVTNTTEYDLDEGGRYTDKYRITLHADLPGMKIRSHTRVYGTRARGREAIFSLQFFVNDVLLREMSNIHNDRFRFTERMWYPNGQLQTERLVDTRVWEDGDIVEEIIWSSDGNVIPSMEEFYVSAMYDQMNEALSEGEAYALTRNANYAPEYSEIAVSEIGI